MILMRKMKTKVKLIPAITKTNIELKVYIMVFKKIRLDEVEELKKIFFQEKLSVEKVIVFLMSMFCC